MPALKKQVMLQLKKRGRENTFAQILQKHLNSPLATANSVFRMTGGDNLSLSMASLGRRVYLSGPHRSPLLPPVPLLKIPLLSLYDLLKNVCDSVCACACVCMSALTQAHGKWQTCTPSTKRSGQGCREHPVTSQPLNRLLH